MRKWIPLAIWVMLALFPLAWVGQVAPRYKDFIDRLMAPEWLHIVTHLLIYAGLTIMLHLNLSRQGRRLFLSEAILIILVVGVFQELFQIISGPAWFYPWAALQSSLFDLGVNLVGGLVGFEISRRLLWLKLMH